LPLQSAFITLIDMAKRPKRNKKQELERAKKRRQKRQARNAPWQARLTPRGAYTLFEHPKRVFEIEFPSAWKHTIEDDSRSVGFRPKDRDDVALSCYIMPYSVDVEAIVEDPKLVKLCEKLFKQVNAVNPRRDATIRHFAMKADRNQEGLAGHFWLVAACDIFLGLSAYCPDGEQHLWNPMFERMLATFRIPREKEALANRAIVRLMGKLKERHPGEKYQLKELELVGKNHAIPLGNLLLRIKNAPGDWEKLTDEFFETTVKVLYAKDLGYEQLDDVRDEIFPFIRPDSVGSEEGRLVKSEWLADLNVTYVIRIPSGFRYITEPDLERWGIEREEIHQLAIGNLCKLGTAAAMPEPPEGALPFLMLAAGDNMEASRLLHPRLYERFAETLGGPFVAAIPCRDALILFPNDRDMRRKMQELVRNDYETSAYAITDRLFLVTPDGATLAEW